VETTLYLATLIAALGAGLMAGTFFAFSAFVMTALRGLPSIQGIAAMQSINTAVMNPAFLGVFTGTAILSLVLTVATFIAWPLSRAASVAGGTIFYVAGCFLVTALCNVPLNNALARAEPESVGGVALWRHYLSRWTLWNTIRTVASLAAAALFITALR